MDKAAAENSGFRVVSVTPTLKEGHAVAILGLLRGEELKSVEQALD